MIGSWRHPIRLTVKEIRAEATNYYYDVKAGKRVVRWIETHGRHFEGPLAGQRVVLSRWQKKVLIRWAGWRWKDTGYRVVREIFIFIPRKNGKSAFTSFFGNYLLLGDNEMAPTIVVAAGSDEQARQVFKGCKDNVEGDLILKRLVGEGVSKNSIVWAAKNGELKVLSSKADTKHGGNLSGVIVDEVHVQPNRDLIDVLHTSTSARPQPITVYLTTAGTDTESICFELYTYAKDILKRDFKDHAFFPVIYEAETTDNIYDEAVWAKANPGLGVSKYKDYMERELVKAQRNASYLNTVKRLEFNLWTGKYATWIDRTIWDSVGSDKKIADFKGQGCFVGMDLSSNCDLTSVVVIIPEDTGKTEVRLNEKGKPQQSKIFNYHVFPYFWLPESSLDPEHTNRNVRLLAKLKRWSELGYLRLMESKTIDTDEIVTFISNEIGGTLKIEEIVGDKWNAITAMNQLTKLGFTVVEWAQNFGKMNSPTKFVETKILQERLFHDKNPVLTWNFENVAIEEDATGNKRPNKRKSTEKIDGVVAMIMGFGRVEQWETKHSVYRNRGLILL